jgi:hypothetical protein
VDLANMAGVQNSLIISRTEAGRQGTAGAWPSNRGVRGLITQVKGLTRLQLHAHLVAAHSVSDCWSPHGLLLHVSTDA